MSIITEKNMLMIENDLKIKSLLILIFACIIVVFGIYQFFEYKRYRVNLDILNSKPEIVAPGVVSKPIIFDDSILKNQINELRKENAAIIKLIKSRDQKITDIGVTLGYLKQTVKRSIESNKKYVNENKPQADYYFKKVYATAADGKEFPISWAMFYPNRPDEEKWKVGTYPLEYNSRIILSSNDKTSDSIFSLWIENNQMKETKGNKYPLEVKKFNWIKEEKKKEFSFNPRLGLNVIYGVNELFPSINISTFSYGYSDNDVYWRFLTLGIGTDDDKCFFSLSPVSYNIGKVLPLIDNLFLEPYVYTDTNLDYKVGVGVSVLF